MTYLVITKTMVSFCDSLDIAINLTKECRKEGDVTLKVINAPRNEVLKSLEKYA